MDPEMPTTSMLTSSIAGMDSVSENKLSKEEMRRLREATSHLPLETVLSLLESFDNCVDSVIKYCQEMVVPDLLAKLSAQLVIASCIDRDGKLSKVQSSRLIKEGDVTMKKFFNENEGHFPVFSGSDYLRKNDEKDDAQLKSIYDDFFEKYPELFEKEEEVETENNPNEEPQIAIEEEDVQPPAFTSKLGKTVDIDSENTVANEEITSTASTSRPKRTSNTTRPYSPEPMKKKICQSTSSCTETGESSAFVANRLDDEEGPAIIISDQKPVAVEHEELTTPASSSCVNSNPETVVAEEARSHEDNAEEESQIPAKHVEVTPPASASRPKRIQTTPRPYSPEPVKKRTHGSNNSRTETVQDGVDSQVPSTSSPIRTWARPSERNNTHVETGLDVANGCLNKSPYNDAPTVKTLNRLKKENRIATGKYIGHLSPEDIASINDIDTTVMEDMRKGRLIIRKKRAPEISVFKIDNDSVDTSTALSAEEIRATGNDGQNRTGQSESSPANDVPCECNNDVQNPRENISRKTNDDLDSSFKDITPASSCEPLFGESEIAIEDENGKGTPGIVTPSPRNCGTPED